MTADKIHAKIVQHLKWHGRRIRGKAHLRFLTLALCGEAGELANLVKKDWRGDRGTAKRREKIISEISDVGAYAFMMARHLGVDFLDEVLRKLNAVERRKNYKRGKRR